MTMRMFRASRTPALLPLVLGCTVEAAGGVDAATEASTGDSPTSFTPTSADEPTTAAHDVSTSTAASASTGGPDGTSGPAGCGDGLVEAGEECDEGADNDASADCTDECRVHACGDGKVHAVLEECDEGAANVDTGLCRSDCKLNVCGDGSLHVGVEECDHGGNNGPVYGGCDEACTVNRCGDGELDAEFEQCDEGAENGSGEAGCGTDCGFSGRRLFLSSKLFTGAMGSRAGADLACRQMAGEAGLKGADKYRALLADTKVSPDDFLAGDASGLPFLAVSGEVLASSYTELIDQGPGAGVTLTETGEILQDRLVWTNIGQFGGSFDTSEGSACDDWKSADPGKSAVVGINAVGVWDLPEWQAGHQWFVHATKACDLAYRIYCVEVL